MVLWGCRALTSAVKRTLSLLMNPIGHGVNLAGTAADSWKSLTDVQDKVTDMGRLAAGNQLRSIRHIDGKDLDAHFCLLRKAWKKFNDQGGGMSDTDFRMVVLASMRRQCQRSG